MPSPKKEIKIEPEKTDLEIENTSLDLQSVSLEEQAQKELDPQMIKVLKKIAYYTSKVGLTLEESCSLVDIEYQKFIEQIKQFPIIGKIIKMKELQYKKDLMYTVSQKAKSGDDKMALWLLERRYPDEFGAKKVAPDSGDEELLFQAVQIIRKKSNDLVNPDAGKALITTRAGVLSEKKGTPFTTTERINNILNG